MDREAASRLRLLVERTVSASRDIGVVLVINVLGQTVLRKDYRQFKDFSVSASFLKSLEVDDILVGLERSGFLPMHFADESQFMRWALTGGMDAVPRLKTVVYTAALAGVGPGRRSLVPAFCAHRQIPTMNPNAYASALNRHKYHWFLVLRAAGIPLPRTWAYDAESGWLNDDVPPKGTTIVGKPSHEGSSIGLTVDTVGPFNDAIASAIHDLSVGLQQIVTVQEFVRGDEFEVPVVRLGNRYKSLTPVEIRKSNGETLHDSILPYEEAAEDQYVFVEPSAHPSLDSMQRIAERVSAIFPFAGISRVDFRRDCTSNEPKVIDVSGTPHLTRNSSVAHRFRELGFKYDEVLACLVGMAIDDDWFSHRTKIANRSA